MRIGDQETNRLQVLKALRRAEPVSRSELAKLTRLSGATITEIVADLLSRDLLLEEKAPPGGMGRRRVQLWLNPGAAYVVGAYLGTEGGLNVEINNLRGEKLFVRSTPISLTADVEAFVEQIADIVHETIAASPFERAAIHSIGLALPALVDSDSGVLHWLQPYAPQSVSIASIIERRVDLPVIIDNSANVVARAEHWFGDDRQVDDFSMFMLGLGMGFGRYVDGALWRGAHGVNPEMSHVKMGLEGGLQCKCGARGCLTTYCTISGIVQRVCEGRGRATPPFEEMTALFHDFVAQARAGDRLVWDAFNLAGRALGTAVANYLNTWDPARVLILVTDGALAEVITPAFYAALQENTLPALRGRAPVQLKVTEEARYSQGAAALVLERLYRNYTKSTADHPALAPTT
jgi:predicted NBD/HSP70 family sugar kinase